MGALHGVGGEILKMRHTAFFAIHIIVPVLGALAFLAYDMVYEDMAAVKRLELILEVTATFFPLLISVMVGLNLSQEERACRFQLLLSAPFRCGALLAKLAVLYGAGILALLLLIVLYMTGTNLLHGPGVVQTQLLQAAAGLAFCSLSIYLVHLFLNLRFSLGISLFWGVFESLQCILYSNVTLQGLWRYVPFAWSMDWIGDVLDGRLPDHRMEWVRIGVLSLLLLAAMMVWFSRWEGRKKME